MRRRELNRRLGGLGDGRQKREKKIVRHKGTKTRRE